MAAHSICNLRFNMSNEIAAAFHNGSNYDYDFFMKELANDFKDKFECLRENTEKHKTFSVPIEKEIGKIEKDGTEDITSVSYKIKFVDSARFMTSSLSNFVEYLAEGIHKIRCKHCNCFLEYKCVNDNLIKYKCLLVIKTIQRRLMKN